MTERKIVTHYDPKPIPYFGLDYTAQREGDDGEDLCGWGSTEAEAIAGRKNIPVIQFADGLVLVEPSDADLRIALTERGLI